MTSKLVDINEDKHGKTIFWFTCKNYKTCNQVVDRYVNRVQDYSCHMCKNKRNLIRAKKFRDGKKV